MKEQTGITPASWSAPRQVDNKKNKIICHQISAWWQFLCYRQILLVLLEWS